MRCKIFCVWSELVSALWAPAFSTRKMEYLPREWKGSEKGNFLLLETFLQGVPYPIAYEPSDLYLRMALERQVSKNSVG